MSRIMLMTETYRLTKKTGKIAEMCLPNFCPNCPQWINEDGYVTHVQYGPYFN